MSNKLYEENNIQAIANAIRAKNGSSDTYTVSQMASAIRNIPDKMPTITNGRIEELYMGDYEPSSSSYTSVPANYFVQFNYYCITNSVISGSSQYFRTIALDTNKFLNISSYYSSSNTPKLSFKLLVETINNHSLTCGEEVIVHISDYNSSQFEIVKLSQNLALLVHRCNQTTNIECIPITINGYNITAGESYTIQSFSGSSNNSFQCKAIGENKVMVIYSKYRQKYVYGLIFKYDNGTYTIGTETQLTSGSNYTYSNSMFAYNGVDRGVVIYPETISSNKFLKANAFSVSGLSITVNYTGSTISTGFVPLGNNCNVEFLKDNLFAVAYVSGNISSPTGYIQTITVNDDLTITRSTRTTALSADSIFRIIDNYKMLLLDTDVMLITGTDLFGGVVFIIAKYNSTNNQFDIKRGGKVSSGTSNAYNPIPIIIDNSNNNVLIMVKGGSYMQSSRIGFIDMTWRLSGSMYLISLFRKVIRAFEPEGVYGKKHIDGIALETITRTTPGNVYVFKT